jgi:hypothetical protein
MQAGRPHVELTRGPAGGRHREGPFDDRAPARLTAVRSLMPMMPSSIGNWLFGAGFGDCA